MKTISTTAIVALMTISAGLTAAAPAMAQDAQPRAQQQQHQQLHRPGDGPGRHMTQQRLGNNGPGRGGMLGGLLDFGRDGENIEVAVVRLAHRIELTDAQKTLLDAFKTAALSAQADFASAVDAVRPAAGTTPTERPDIVARLAQRITMEKAHVEALSAVQPSFEAFFTSLTDAQKGELMPQRNQRTGWQGKRPRPGQDGTEAPADVTIDATPSVNG
ncbi:MAG TPA: Spy/CpxP family protein refolding chaperone [Devosia sp.]|nr:Spy/CpxP family protein refolding chaperone [Devosia sp.]